MKKQIVSLMVVASSLFAGDLVTFTAGTPAKASEVNANFSELESRIADLQQQLNNCNCNSSNILYSENFTTNPHFTSLSTTGKATWNQANGYYRVETKDDLNDKYWAYSPNIGQINPKNKDIELSFDILIENQNYGTYPRIGFYSSIPTEMNDNSRVFLLENGNADHTRESFDLMTFDNLSSTHARTSFYNTGTYTVDNNEWYTIKIVTSNLGTKATITITKKSDNTIVKQFDDVDFPISTFSYIGIGYYDKADYGSDWAPMRIDNILIKNK